MLLFAVACCPNGNRWMVLRTLARSLTDAEYWQCLRYVYQHTETLWEQRNVGRLLNAKRPGRDAFMHDAERTTLAGLPEVVSIHRGGQLHNLAGWSWTLDTDKARWFALRGFEPPPIGLIGELVHR